MLVEPSPAAASCAPCTAITRAFYRLHVLLNVGSQPVLWQAFMCRLPNLRCVRPAVPSHRHQLLMSMCNGPVTGALCPVAVHALLLPRHTCTITTSHAQEVVSRKAAAKSEFQARYGLTVGTQHQLVVFLGELSPAASSSCLVLHRCLRGYLSEWQDTALAGLLASQYILAG